MEYFLVRYASRVVIYKHKTFIRLATGISKPMFRDECAIPIDCRPLVDVIKLFWRKFRFPQNLEIDKSLF